MASDDDDAGVALSFAASCTLPKRRKVGATRTTIPARRFCGRPVYHSSRVTASASSSLPRTASERAAGTPIATSAASPRSSRHAFCSTARPSPPREYGVRPEPLSATSHANSLELRASPPRSSPSEMERPSPSCPAQFPNWWPAYACAYGVAPRGTRAPERTAANSGSPAAPAGSRSSRAVCALVASTRGVPTHAVGRTRETDAFFTWRTVRRRSWSTRRRRSVKFSKAKRPTALLSSSTTREVQRPSPPTPSLQSCSGPHAHTPEQSAP